MKFFAVLFLALVCLLGSCVVKAQRSNCAVPCPLNYAPTCGFNGQCYREFANECVLHAAGCEGGSSFRKVDLSECQGATARRC